MSNERIEYPDFETFWKHFMTSHQSSALRWCHVAALAAGVTGVAAALKTRRLAPLALGVGAAAALAVLPHPILTGVWPENFGYPAYGGRAFLRLCVRTVLGTFEESPEEHDFQP